MALDISRWRNNPATEEHHDNKSNLAKNGLVYAKVAQLVEQVNTYFYLYWKIQRLQIQTKKVMELSVPVS